MYIVVWYKQLNIMALFVNMKAYEIVKGIRNGKNSIISKNV